MVPGDCCFYVYCANVHFHRKKNPLTNFEIKSYYQNEPRFKGVYSENNLPKTKDGPYVINLSDYKSIGTHCIALHVNGDNVTYLDSFEVFWNIKKFKSL